MFRRILQKFVQVSSLSMAKPRLNNQVGGLGLVLSGSILSWLNIKKEEQLLLPNSSAATRIDPDSQLVETIRLAAKSIHVNNAL